MLRGAAGGARGDIVQEVIAIVRQVASGLAWPSARRRLGAGITLSILCVAIGVLVFWAGGVLSAFNVQPTRKPSRSRSRRLTPKGEKATPSAKKPRNILIFLRFPFGDGDYAQSNGQTMDAGTVFFIAFMIAICAPFVWQG